MSVARLYTDKLFHHGYILLQKPELESKLKVDRLMPKAQSFIEKVGS